MKKELIDEMNNFAIRVLKGGSKVSPQEAAILPSVLGILKSFPNTDETEKGPQQMDEALAEICKRSTCQR